jgi:hypothetical protein
MKKGTLTCFSLRSLDPRLNKFICEIRNVFIICFGSFYVHCRKINEYQIDPNIISFSNRNLVLIFIKKSSQHEFSF